MIFNSAVAMDTINNKPSFQEIKAIKDQLEKMKNALKSKKNEAHLITLQNAQRLILKLNDYKLKRKEGKEENKAIKSEKLALQEKLSNVQDKSRSMEQCTIDLNNKKEKLENENNVLNLSLASRLSELQEMQQKYNERCNNIITLNAKLEAMNEKMKETEEELNVLKKERLRNNFQLYKLQNNLHPNYGKLSEEYNALKDEHQKYCDLGTLFEEKSDTYKKILYFMLSNVAFMAKKQAINNKQAFYTVKINEGNFQEIMKIWQNLLDSDHISPLKTIYINHNRARMSLEEIRKRNMTYLEESINEEREKLENLKKSLPN